MEPRGHWPAAFRSLQFKGANIGRAGSHTASSQRMDQGRDMEKLDMGRYRVEAPAEAHSHDESAWQSALDNAGAQTQHQQLRVLNLELQNKFSAKVWGALNRVLDKSVTDMEVGAAPLCCSVSVRSCACISSLGACLRSTHGLSQS